MSIPVVCMTPQRQLKAGATCFVASWNIGQNRPKIDFKMYFCGNFKEISWGKIHLNIHFHGLNGKMIKKKSIFLKTWLLKMRILEWLPAVRILVAGVQSLWLPDWQNSLIRELGFSALFSFFTLSFLVVSLLKYSSVYRQRIPDRKTLWNHISRRKSWSVRTMQNVSNRFLWGVPATNSVLCHARADYCIRVVTAHTARTELV